MLSLLEAMQKFGILFYDFLYTRPKKVTTYTNNSETDTDAVEDYSKGDSIDYLKSGALKNYIRFKKDINNYGLFTPSNVYPIADVENEDVIKELERQEELFNYQFGIVYKSKYNQMVVDPIMGSDGKFFPYERVIPTAGNGVVIITIHDDNFLMLKQFRHAIRSEQYSFPRGYAEPNVSPEDNVKKEILEELGASVKNEPVLLGRFEPDSGLTSSSVMVYLCEIDDYTEKHNYEGIRQVVEITEMQLQERIQHGEISDGFSLAAFEIYESIY
jgi:8-oxo-dGTP pyrophosphatase MutT (NUDIX family)